MCQIIAMCVFGYRLSPFIWLLKRRLSASALQL
jgi:hypothetical protein